MNKNINLNGRNINLDELSTNEIQQILNNINKDELKLKQELNEILESLT